MYDVLAQVFVFLFLAGYVGILAGLIVFGLAKNRRKSKAARKAFPSGLASKFSCLLAI
jgi:hypothetical protein